MTELSYLSAVEAAARFRSGELSPVELMNAVIERAEAVEPLINAFAETFYDEALEAAREAERRFAGGSEAPRALEGIPVAVKEEAPIAGQRNTLGSLVLRDAVASETAVFAQRLLEAGAIVHARTTTPEFSVAGVTWSLLWGVTRNPWRLDRSPGGSSGGSAAALAAGMTTLATGSDIGGSIRIPASMCGVVGFKPPYGRVPEGELFNLDHYCHEGPLARTVADAAALENVMAGPHPSDVASLRPKLELPPTFTAPSGMRVALSVDLGCYEVDEDVAANTREAAEALRQTGVVVEEVSLPWDLAEINRAVRIHFGVIFGPSMQRLYDEHADELTSYTRRFVEDSASVEKADFLEGLALEAKIYAPLGALLEEFDALICPTLALPAVPAEYDDEPVSINGRQVDAESIWMTVPFNIASRCPVLAVPSGLSRDGVPTGLSVVGRTYDDLSVFRVAAAYERARPWLDVVSRRPPLDAAGSPGDRKAP